MSKVWEYLRRSWRRKKTPETVGWRLVICIPARLIERYEGTVIYETHKDALQARHKLRHIIRSDAPIKIIEVLDGRY